MSISVIGINHKTASVELREKVAFSPDNLNAALQQLKDGSMVDEAVIVSTCNRTELYFSGAANSHGVIDWLANFHSLEKETLNQSIYSYEQSQAVSHLLRVASGLDSLVLGEPQILGQLKQAFADAKANDAATVLLQRLFQHAFSVAKQVRTETEIGASAVSVAFAAVNLAKHIFGDLSKASVLLVGAGETIELVARHLSEQGVANITVANRTIARAQALAEPLNGKAITLQQIPGCLADADIVIGSTASPLPIIGKGLVEVALKQRKHKPMFLVDLAVPRDIEAQVNELKDAYLYTVDDIQQIVEQNRQSRQEAALEAEAIVLEQTEQFQAWLRSLDAVDVIRQYRKSAEEQKHEALSRAFKQLAAEQDAKSVVVELANKLTNSLIHSPTSALKKAGEKGDEELLATIANSLGINSNKED